MALSYPLVRESPKVTNIVTKIRQYRKLHTLNSIFLQPYQEHQIDGLMHPDYNQIVRTGRMSCRRPNSQQLSKEAKALIHPPSDDMEILSWDYSQIEFRLIVHYIKDAAAIAAFTKNPDTDFHQWVADMCQIPRDPAKNVNFAIAFGGGKARVVSMLSLNMDLVGNLADKADQLIEAGKCDISQRQKVFELLCNQRGEQVYNEYHGTLPGIKSKTKTARDNLISRGFVFNAYGRQRHLPEKAGFRAFNTIIQSCAADVIKERMVALAPRYNKFIRYLGIKNFASVHDEVAMYAPKGLSKDMVTLMEIKSQFEDTAIKFRVPMRIACGVSDKNWAIAGGKAGKIKVPDKES